MGSEMCIRDRGREITVLLVDGYIDDPAALGVPPYISPIIRAIAGAALDAGADRVEYVTIDMIRHGARLPQADVSVVMSGNTVPGKYLRSMPMSVKELEALFPKLSGAAFGVAVTGDQSELALHLAERVFRALDAVAHTLTGDARVLRDLRERQIFVIVQVEQLALLFCERLAVKVEQQAHFERFAFHRRASLTV